MRHSRSSLPVVLFVSGLGLGLLWTRGDSSNTSAQSAAAAAPSDRNVVDFGANGDDDEHDTAAFRNALAAGEGRVIVPPGRYILRQDLKLSAGVQLVGSGHASHLVLEGVAIVVDGTATHTPFWAIENLRLTRTGAAGPCISLRGNDEGSPKPGAIRGRLEDVEIDGSTGDGIEIICSYILWFERTIVRKCQRSGIRIRPAGGDMVGTNALEIRGGEIQYCRIGIDAFRSKQVLLSGVTIQGNRQAGIVLDEYCAAWLISACYFETNGPSHIVLGANSLVTGVTIDTCRFYNKPTADIAQHILMNRVSGIAVRGGHAHNAETFIRCERTADTSTAVTGRSYCERPVFSSVGATVTPSGAMGVR